VIWASTSGPLLGREMNYAIDSVKKIVSRYLQDRSEYVRTAITINGRRLDSTFSAVDERLIGKRRLIHCQSPTKHHESPSIHHGSTHGCSQMALVGQSRRLPCATCSPEFMKHRVVAIHSYVESYHSIWPFLFLCIDGPMAYPRRPCRAMPSYWPSRRG